MSIQFHDPNARDPQDWVGCKFTVADLKDKTVEYSFRDEGGNIHTGEGRLIAVAKGDLMRVRILTSSGLTPDRSAVVANAFIIPGRDAAKLVRNPSGSKCEFSIKAL